jgi:N-acetylneuraminic acid mutarotase
MKSLRTLTFFTTLFLLAFSLRGGVPHLISYQGRVTVGNDSFSGTGLFKFALVGSEGEPSYWSNDGSSVNGSVPTFAVPINVGNGLFSVLLGDDMLPNMSAIPLSVFTNSDVRLRIWFSDGTHSFAKLAPDQRISAVGYAMMAGNVADGSITSAKLADGAITSAKLAPGAVTSNLTASGQSGVASGGIILSLEASSPTLTGAGFHNIGSISETAERWQSRANGPGRRFGHTAVWTGTRMLVWGGGAGVFLNNGGRYDPAANSWQPITTSGAPTGRWHHEAVWTGTEMLVWGGRASPFTQQGAMNDGGRYNPVSDTWSPITSAGAPERRSEFVAVWTGSEMLVWGGTIDGGASLATGARYNPFTDAWTPMSTNGAPFARNYPVAVWTGTEMIIWGGGDVSGGDFHGSRNDGGRYNPTTDHWTPLPTNGAPSGVAAPRAVWSGTEMIVWGGLDYDRRTPYNTTVSVASGARYSPTTDSWKSLPTLNAPLSRGLHSATWTGSEMVVWGGVNREVQAAGQVYLNDGARYNPLTDAWTPLSVQGAPSPRVEATAIWTGQVMIIYGGYNDQDGNAESNTTHAWNPGRVLYLYQRL